MLKKGWHDQCHEFLEIESPAQQDTPFNLSFPHSQCPQCATPLKWWHNIPVFSYLLLKGKCAWCKCKISPRYPLIEIITIVGSIHLTTHFGIGWTLLAALILFWSLICLTGIDFDHHLLPDNITIPLVWLGLIVNNFGLFTDISSALIGAVGGYLSFWLLFQIHYRLTGREGLGYGDFKLLAALGAWLGWQSLPLIVLLSSLVGLMVALPLMIVGKLSTGKPISYGPFLAIAGWVALVWGETLTSHYLHILNL